MSPFFDFAVRFVFNGRVQIFGLHWLDFSIIVIYLVSARRNSAVAMLSVKELIVGRVAVAFWGGLIVLGIIVPLAISVSSFFTGTVASSIMLITAISCHTIGAFALKYCLLKVGIHRPILPKVAAY